MSTSDIVAQRIEQITARVAPVDEPREVEFDGIALYVGSGVFDPSRGRSARKMAQMLAEHPPRPGDRVLEIGTGTGLLSILAHRYSRAPVVAVDIMPEAVRSAKINFEWNDVPGAVAVSDMFSAVVRRDFDCVIFNAPTAHPSVTPDNPGLTTLWDMSGQLKARFVADVAGYLNPNNPHAKALMMYSLYADYDAVTPLDFAKHGLTATRCLVDRDEISEAGVLLITRSSPSPSLA